MLTPLDTVISTSNMPRCLGPKKYWFYLHAPQGSRQTRSSSSSYITARVIGASQMISNQFRPFFSVLQCPLGLGELQACPLPDAVFPPLLLYTLSSSPFHCALQRVLARPDERETCPHHCSLRLFTIVLMSSCGPNVTWSLYEMRSIWRWQLFSMGCILACSSAERVHGSQAYRKMAVIR